MRQSGSITNAVIELICNACDAGAARVIVNLRQAAPDEHGGPRVYLTVSDDGTGLGGRDAALKSFSSLGGSAKKGENKFGTFGIGRCQILAFSDEAKWVSGDICVRMHLGESDEDQGVRIEYLPEQQRHDSGTVVSVILNAAATEKILSANLADVLKKRLYYIACRVEVNDYTRSPYSLATTTASNGEPLRTRHEWVRTDKLAYYRIVTPGTGRYEIYNMGVHCYHNYLNGATDADIHVITRVPVALNVARNQISDTCEVFREVQKNVDEIARARVLDLVPCDAQTAARSFTAMCALKRGTGLFDLTAHQAQSKLRALARRRNVAAFTSAGRHVLVSASSLAKRISQTSPHIPVVVPTWVARYDRTSRASRMCEAAQQAVTTGRAVGLDADWADAVIEYRRHCPVELPADWDSYDLDGRMRIMVYLLNLAAGHERFAVMDISALQDDTSGVTPGHHVLQDTEQHVITSEGLTPKLTNMQQVCTRMVHTLSKAWVPDYPIPRVLIFNGGQMLHRRRALTDGVGTIWVSSSYLEKVSASAASPAPFLTLALTMAHELMHILGVQRGLTTLRDEHADFYRAFHDRVCCADSDGASNLIGLTAYRGFQQYWSNLLAAGETPAPLEMKALQSNLGKLGRVCDLLLANAEGADNGSAHGTVPEKIAGSSLP